MRIAVGIDTNSSLEKVIERSRVLVGLGLSEQWSSQIMGPDTLTVMAVVGREVPGANLGTAVVPVQPRHPAMLAAQARTVQSMIGGHLSLGIGLSHQVVVEGMWGISFDRPAAYMAEYLAAFGPLLRGEPVDVHGERVSAVSTGPVGPKDVDAPSLLVAALGPVMLKMTGAYTDGTVLWMTGPKTVKNHIVPIIRDAAAAAGRGEPRVVCALPVTVTKNAQEARERTDAQLAFYPHLPSYAAMMKREGATLPSDLAIIGSREEVADRIGALSESGATEFSANVSGDADERDDTYSLLGELASR